jgi:AcrR family transcriptional regulator
MVTHSQTSTRSRILAAAQALLLQEGRGGLRVDQVAAHAGVNKRMIYHHFAHKQGLVDAVLQLQTQRLISPASPLSPASRHIIAVLVGSNIRKQIAEPVQDIASSADELSLAVRLLLPELMAGGARSPMPQVSLTQWQQFALEVMSYAFAEIGGAAKPRYRITSASRVR